jgi:hypothetical protein
LLRPHEGRALSIHCHNTLFTRRIGGALAMADAKIPSWVNIESAGWVNIESAGWVNIESAGWVNIQSARTAQHQA